MLSLHELTSKIKATELSSHRSGDLNKYVEARIRGNYRKGPVPVTVKYTFHFLYSEGWQDESGNTVMAVSKEFDTTEDRDSYVSNHFAAIK